MGLAYYDVKNYLKSIEYYDKAYACMDTLEQIIESIHVEKGSSYEDLK
jgi:tetratricopeptide (TPR) repeat protein